ncbi:MAG: HAMP domain-containing sensor histidine kinase [Candidatus Pacebacteria bacterium]|nr:HAMP domain-containing sensor histidine kinase [Candidatus Paceibacterota bacterium]
MENNSDSQKLIDANNELDKVSKMLVRRDRELSLVKEQALQVDELKSEFVSTVAHQLRTPLAGNKWILSMLSHGEVGPVNEEQKAFLVKVYNSNERMVTLVSELLDIDRVTTNRIKYTFVEADIFTLINKALAELSPSVEMKGIRIFVEGRDSGIPKVFIDADKIAAVLQNLIDNATKYTLGSGDVIIKVEKNDGHVKLSVKDNGIGIPKNVQNKIFTLFYRAPNATQVEIDGSGAGLYLSKKILNKHGTDIWFESEEGKGSTFYVTLPTKPFKGVA